MTSAASLKAVLVYIHYSTQPDGGRLPGCAVDDLDALEIWVLVQIKAQCESRELRLT